MAKRRARFDLVAELDQKVRLPVHYSAIIR
jgi:hypothetical protein